MTLTEIQQEQEAILEKASLKKFNLSRGLLFEHSIISFKELAKHTNIIDQLAKLK